MATAYRTAMDMRADAGSPSLITDFNGNTVSGIYGARRYTYNMTYVSNEPMDYNDFPEVLTTKQGAQIVVEKKVELELLD